MILKIVMIAAVAFLALHNVLWVLIAEERRKKYDRLWNYMIGKRKDY